jgi:hypothetical protein
MAKPTNTKPQLLPGGVTQEQVDTWKKENKEVHRVYVQSLEDPKREFVAYAKTPDKATLAAAAKYVSDDPVKAGDIIGANCILFAEPELKADDRYVLALNMQIGSLFKIPAARLEKL